ncbi:MAG TPA: DegT/DnrJ/EryC1/StrS family aminotransferase [Bryobacteraceae bacterium]|nr:DegT/DnrJ/EryC1/StrS family aminotransferase [Bryobacteraceae bacterium]
MSSNLTRRQILAAIPAAAVAAAPASKPAMLGGTPAKQGRFPKWPVAGQPEEQALIEVVRSGQWFQGNGKLVKKFEAEYAQLTGAKYCIATSSGTGALHSSLGALGIGAGDEVILPPYTFVATVNVVLLLNALPIFVDSDLESMQIDPGKVEAAITDRTAAIIPVHYSGNVADLDRLLPVAAKRKLPVIEDTCQSHLSEWRGRKAGTYGATGCFSFQASKNLNCGEGGAIISNDDDLIEKCYAFHYNGSGRKPKWVDTLHGTKYLMTEFQAAILLAQMARLEEQTRTREANARYLTSLLKEIPGIGTQKIYEGCTRHAYHVYKFRYLKEQFAGMPRERFVKAMSAEGVSCVTGYDELNKRRHIKNVLASRGYRRIYSKKVLDAWEERNRCPVNDQLCTQAVGFTQNMLLGPRSDMDQIADAVRKIQAHAGELAKA